MAPALVSVMTSHNKGSNQDDIEQVEVERTTNINNLNPYDHELVSHLRSLMTEEFEINRDAYAEDDIQRTLDTHNNWHVWRYLSWYNYNISNAFEGMKSLLQWRKSFGVSQIKLSETPREFWLFGPLFWCGETEDGVSNVYIIGRFYFPSSDIRPMVERFIIYMLETFDRTRPPSDKLNFIIENYGATLSNVDLSLVKWLISVKDVYNVRLNGVYIVGIPFILRPIVSLIIGWLPEQFRQITYCGTFDGLLRPNIRDENIPDIYGGQCPRETYRLAPVESRPLAEFDNADKLDKPVEMMTRWLSDEDKAILREHQDIYAMKSKSSSN